MDIYLQSRGRKGGQDYRWLKVYESSKFLKNVLEEPQILEKISQFYQPDTPTVILYRKDQKLILFIYWLTTKQRSLEYGRPVQNSLVFIGGEENDCLLFQMLASKALENWQLFADNFDTCVQWWDDEYGFHVEESSFEKFIFKKDVVKDYEQLETPDETRKLARDVLNVKSKSPEKQKIVQETKQKWIKALAEELKTTKLPDDWDRPLVVVAENVAEEVLQRHVWRGISDRVAHTGGWKEIDTKKPILWIILAIVLISLLVLSLVIFSLRQTQNNPTPQQTIIKQSPTPTNSLEPEIQPSPTPTTSSQVEIQPDSNPESQSSTKTPTQPDSSNPETPITSSSQEEQLDGENNSST